MRKWEDRTKPILQRGIPYSTQVFNRGSELFQIFPISTSFRWELTA